MTPELEDPDLRLTPVGWAVCVALAAIIAALLSMAVLHDKKARQKQAREDMVRLCEAKLPRCCDERSEVFTYLTCERVRDGLYR